MSPGPTGIDSDRPIGSTSAPGPTPDELAERREQQGVVADRHDLGRDRPAGRGDPDQVAERAADAAGLGLEADDAGEAADDPLGLRPRSSRSVRGRVIARHRPRRAPLATGAGCRRQAEGLRARERGAERQHGAAVAPVEAGLAGRRRGVGDDLDPGAGPAGDGVEVLGAAPHDRVVGRG